jgi:hypothetical protein
MPKSLSDASRQAWRWMKADPESVTTVLRLTLYVVEVVEERRWFKANGLSRFSVRGMTAYVRARPVRFAITALLSLLPDLVGAALRARSAAEQQEQHEGHDGGQQEGPEAAEAVAEEEEHGDGGTPGRRT